MSSDQNTPKKGDPPAFLPQHVEYLKARGIPIDLAVRAGVQSFTCPTREAAKSLKRRFPGIAVYPSSGLLTEYLVQPLDRIARARIRWDDDKYYKGTPGTQEEESKPIPRYSAQRDVPVVPYYPPGILTEGIQDDPSVDLYIVEAPMKALALTANGFPAIGLGGVEAGFHDTTEWKTSKHLVINRELDRVLWKGRRVFIVYDAGIQNNPPVALGAAKLATVLKNRGGEAYLVILPLLHVQQRSLDDLILYGDDDQGPDDFLAREGKAAFQQLIDDAVPADAVARVKNLMDANSTRDGKRDGMAALLSDLTFVSAVEVGGPLVLDQVADLVTKPTGIGKRAIQEQVGKLHKRLESRNETDTAEHSYKVEDGRIATEAFLQGVPSVRYLADFAAEVVEEIVTDDGLEQGRVLRIAGKLPDGKVLPAVEVPATEFGKLDWVTAAWGTKAIVRAGRDTKDRVREAIQQLSNPTEATVYTHLGWREVGGKLVYLHPGGAIGSDAPVRVRVNTERGALCFPDEVQDLQRAIKLSLSILDTGPMEITLPALASAYTAVLAEVLELDFGVWFVGPSGSLKSTLAAKGMAHYGKFDYHSLPANWNSTAGSLEAQLFRLKDALLVIDNYVPGATQRDHQQLMTAALRVVQAIGDRSGRGRLNRNAEERPSRRPRGLALMTGEDLPPNNESTIGRLLVVDVKKGDLDLGKLAAIQDQADLLPHALLGFIEWLAPRLQSDAGWVRQRRKGTASRYRGLLADAGVHERAPNSLSALATGFELLLDFAFEVGAIDADVHDHLGAQAEQALLTVARKQQGNVEGVKSTERYLSTLRTLLSQGRAALAKKDQQLSYVTLPGSAGIGWEDGEYVYLLPEAAWHAVVEFNAREGWPFKKTQLHKQLADAGVIERPQTPSGESRLTVRETLGGSTKRVFRIAKLHFEGDIPDADTDKQEAEAQEQERRDAMREQGIAFVEFDEEALPN